MVCDYQSISCTKQQNEPQPHILFAKQAVYRLARKLRGTVEVSAKLRNVIGTINYTSVLHTSQVPADFYLYRSWSIKIE